MMDTFMNQLTNTDSTIPQSYLFKLAFDIRQIRFFYFLFILVFITSLNMVLLSFFVLLSNTRMINVLMMTIMMQLMQCSTVFVSADLNGSSGHALATERLGS